MTTRPTKKPKLEAEPAFENAQLVARDLLQRIGELLTDMPTPGNDKHPIHWGNVGDVNHVNERLSQVVAFLDGSER